MNLETTEPQISACGQDSPKFANHMEVYSSTELDTSVDGGTKMVTKDSLPSHSPLVDGVSEIGGNTKDHVSSEKSGHVKEGVRKRRIKTTAKCNNEVKSSWSGLWSVEWLHNAQQGDVGLISSKHKRLKKFVKEKSDNGGGSRHVASKKKAR